MVPSGGKARSRVTIREVNAMFGRNGVAGVRTGRMLTALAAALPTIAWAQWWGSYGHPMGPPPGIAAPPAPPSVGQFMTNPGPGAADSSQRSDCSKPEAATKAYYVIAPGMAVPVLYPPAAGPCPDAAGPNAAGPSAEQGGEPQALPEPGQAASEPAGAETDSATTTVTARETASGGVLVDGAGMTLYVTGIDQPGESLCYADCARNWPPAVAPVGARTEGDLAVITRHDGTRQWTFKGRPLYRWAGDKQPGDMAGDGLGSAWAVARTD